MKNLNLLFYHSILCDSETASPLNGWSGLFESDLGMRFAMWSLDLAFHDFAF